MEKKMNNEVCKECGGLVGTTIGSEKKIFCFKSPEKFVFNIKVSEERIRDIFGSIDYGMPKKTYLLINEIGAIPCGCPYFIEHIES